MGRVYGLNVLGRISFWITCCLAWAVWALDVYLGLARVLIYINIFEGKKNDLSTFLETDITAHHIICRSHLLASAPSSLVTIGSFFYNISLTWAGYFSR